MARRKGWRVWGYCRCGYGGPVNLARLSDLLKMRDVEPRLRCTACGGRRCRLVVHEPTAEQETEGQRAERVRVMKDLADGA